MSAIFAKNVKMLYSNYHSHTDYCDGTEKPERYIESAIENGLQSYGFSSHAPLPFSTNWAMDINCLKAYLYEINALKNKYSHHIQIYTAMEVDYIPGISGPGNPLIRNAGLDYTIGSIHFVDNYADKKPWCIDNSHKEFIRGVEEIFDGDVKKAIKRYYELTRMMVRKDCPDIIGHLDKIKMHNHNECFFSEEEDWYRQEVISTLEIIKASNAILEVNTRGFYSRKINDFYPGCRVLKYIAEMDIPVTICSDAHQPDEVNAGFLDAVECLLDIGISSIQVLIDDEWRPYTFLKEPCGA